MIVLVCDLDRVGTSSLPGTHTLSSCHGADERVTRNAMAIFGGNGLMREYPVGQYLRDVLVYVVGEGASEIQKNIVARAMGHGGAGRR